MLVADWTNEWVNEWRQSRFFRYNWSVCLGTFCAPLRSSQFLLISKAAMGTQSCLDFYQPCLDATWQHLALNLCHELPILAPGWHQCNCEGFPQACTWGKLGSKVCRAILDQWGVGARRKMLPPLLIIGWPILRCILQGSSEAPRRSSSRCS